VTVRETVDARKEPIARARALAVARAARRLVVSKGKRSVAVDLAREKLSDDALAALVIGPTGSLRAPAIRVGDVLLVGFHDEAYADVFAR